MFRVTTETKNNLKVDRIISLEKYAYADILKQIKPNSFIDLIPLKRASKENEIIALIGVAETNIGLTYFEFTGLHNYFEIFGYVEDSIISKKVLGIEPVKNSKDTYNPIELIKEKYGEGKVIAVSRKSESALNFLIWFFKMELVVAYNKVEYKIHKIVFTQLTNRHIPYFGYVLASDNLGNKYIIDEFNIEIILRELGITNKASNILYNFANSNNILQFTTEAINDITIGDVATKINYTLLRRKEKEDLRKKIIKNFSKVQFTDLRNIDNY